MAVGHLEENNSSMVPGRNQGSMLGRLNDADDDDMSDSTQSSGEGLEIACKRGVLFGVYQGVSI